MKRLFFFISRLSHLKKVTIHLEASDESGLRIYKAFNKPHPRLFIIRNKTIGVMLINLDEFSKPADYLESVSGKNSTAYYMRRCQKEGYVFEWISPAKWQEAILKINSSQTERQGRKMDNSYLEKFDYPEDDKNLYGGIFYEDKLVAYLWLRFQGELVIVNRILGHADHLKKGIMYLLFGGSIERLLNEHKNTKWVMYDTYFGATEGLKLFKSRLGFKPYIVRWKK